MRAGWSCGSVIDLLFRQTVGWSMRHRIGTEWMLNALMMVLRRRQPKSAVITLSEQGRQFSAHAWQGPLSDHNLVSSMSRRGNCLDNTVAESFVRLLKRERIRRQTDPNCDQAESITFMTSGCFTTLGDATAMLEIPHR